jgi:hypothetical protein
VVAWSFGLPVEAIYVIFDDVKGWYGGTNIPAKSDVDLPLMDQLTSLAAGRISEGVFDCTAHETAWLQDLGQIYERLSANNVPEGEHWAHIKAACDRARPILETHRDKALKLVERLVNTGWVKRSEFLRIMIGEA